MEWDRVEENFTTKMEGATMENGRKTKWMGKELYTISLIKRLMKVSGLMINFMAKERFIMKIQQILLRASIIEISTRSKIIGSTTKV